MALWYYKLNASINKGGYFFKVHCTLCLHAGSDQSQGIAGQLATGAGNGTTAQQHQNPWIGCVFGIVGQPEVLQALVWNTQEWQVRVRVDASYFAKSAHKWCLNRLKLSFLWKYSVVGDSEPSEHFSRQEWFIRIYLIHCQIYPSVGDNAQNIGNVALVKRLHSLFLQDFLGTVKHSRVLSGFPQGHTGFHHLKRQRWLVWLFYIRLHIWLNVLLDLLCYWIG